MSVWKFSSTSTERLAGFLAKFPGFVAEELAELEMYEGARASADAAIVGDIGTEPYEFGSGRATKQ
jgi:hypothetical protein